MFFRAKKSGSKNQPHHYLQIVESFRDGKTVRQRVIATLGRLDHLQSTGQIDGLVKSLVRFSETMRVIAAVKDPKITSCQTRVWGPLLVFERLWDQQRLPEVITLLAAGRRFRFDIERAVFALSLQRLCEPGSDLQGSCWLKTVESPAFEKLSLQHLYRATGFLFDVRQELEKELFFRDRDLFNQQLDLIFLDTTSTYAYRAEESEYCKRGYSRDYRPDLPQFILCVAVDARGWPVAWEIFAGNTADVKAFNQIIAILRERFKIGRVVIVADRGMVSQKTIAELTEHKTAPFDYILGCRMRRQKEISEEVLSRGGRYRKVAADLFVKEVAVGDRRYIICLNPEEAKKDQQTRQAILVKLEQMLNSRGPKSIVTNKGFARFLKVSRDGVTINQEIVKADQHLDGKYVLVTNTKLPAAEVARTYKGLWQVERTFRKEKSVLRIRPIYHHRDENCIGHIAASFLALRLEVDLQNRLDEKSIQASWPSLMRDIKQFQAVKMTLDGKSYLIRTDFQGVAHQAFQAAGVRPPSRVISLKNSPSV
jgi:hypothetical protein